MKHHVGIWNTGPAAGEEEIFPEAPPMAVGLEDRRLQLRGCRHWEALRGQRELPPIGALALDKLPEFATHAALLALRGKGLDPVVTHLGAALAKDCARAAPGLAPIRRAAQVPANSLLGCALGRIAEVVTLRVPIGFEDELRDAAGTRIACRGTLLPFVRGGDSGMGAITHILAIVSGRERASGALHDALHAEIAALGLWDQPPATTPAPDDGAATLSPGALPRP